MRWQRALSLILPRASCQTTLTYLYKDELLKKRLERIAQAAGTFGFWPSLLRGARAPAFQCGDYLDSLQESDQIALNSLNISIDDQ